MASLKYFILLSFFLHSVGMGFFEYHTKKKQVYEKEIVLVKIIAEREEKKSIKTKKIEIEKKKEPFLEKNSTRKSSLTKKEKLFPFKKEIKKKDINLFAESISDKKFSVAMKDKIFLSAKMIKKEDINRFSEDISERKPVFFVKDKLFPSQKKTKREYTALKKESILPVKRVMREQSEPFEFAGNSLFVLSVAETTVARGSLNGEALCPSFLERVSFQGSPTLGNIGVKAMLQEETIDLQKPSKEIEGGDLKTGFAAEDQEGALNTIRSRIERAKRYPLMAKERGMEGTSSIRFRLNDSGEVERIEIVKSSGKGILDRESIRTVKRAAPFPYVAGWIIVPLTYELNRGR